MALPILCVLGSALLLSRQADATQGLASPITYTTPAKPVSQVIQDLSKLANVPLKVNPVASQEIVLLSVTNAPLQGVLDRIATVTSCEWDATPGGGFILKPNGNLRDKEATADFAAKTQKFAGQIQAKADAVAKAEKTAEANAAKAAKGDTKTGDDAAPIDFSAVMAANPDEKTIVQLLGGVDPSVFASLSGEDRAVWATNNPNQMQRPLGVDASSLISDWVRNHNDAAKQMQQANASGSDPTAQMPKFVKDMMAFRFKPITTPIGKCLLIASNTAMLGGLQVKVSVFDTSGKEVLEAASMMDTSTLTAAVEAAQALTKGGTKPPADTSEPIEYSDDSKLLMTALKSTNSASIKMPHDLRVKLMHPETKDPLAYMVSDRYLSYAHHLGRQIVADVPDGAFGSSSFFGTSLKELNTTAAVAADFKSGETAQLTDDGQFLMIKPAKPSESRRVRVDRDALRKLLASAEATRTASLRASCEYALETVPPSENPLSMTYFILFAPVDIASMLLNQGNLNWSTLRFFGSLDDGNWTALQSGRSLPFAQLTPDQQRYAADFLYGTGSHFEDEATAGQSDSFSLISSIMTMAMSFGGQSVGGGSGANEPTELMPNGLPANGYLTCKSSSEQVVFVGSTGEDPVFYLEPSTLALFQSFMKTPQAAGSGGFPKDGWVGSRVKHDLSFHVGSGRVAVCRLADASLPPDAPKVTLSKLPPDLQAQVDAQATLLINSPFGDLASLAAGGFGKMTPPP